MVKFLLGVLVGFVGAMVTAQINGLNSVPKGVGMTNDR